MLVEPQPFYIRKQQKSVLVAFDFARPEKNNAQNIHLELF
jgi:hypothetical protein